MFEILLVLVTCGCALNPREYAKAIGKLRDSNIFRSFSQPQLAGTGQKMSSYTEKV